MRSVQRSAERADYGTFFDELIWKSVTVETPIYSTVKNSKVEGKDLRKSGSGVMRFMRCKRGGWEWFTYPRAACI